MMRRSSLMPMAGVLAAALALGLPPSAGAQEERDAAYLHLGPGTVHPWAIVGETYSDNVYATADDPASDWYTTLGAGISLNLPADTMEFELGGGVNVGRYAEYSDLDWDDWNLFGRGTFVVREGFVVEVGDVYTVGHENPLESTTGALETYTSNAGRVALRYDFLDFWQARLGYRKTVYNYDGREEYRSRDEGLLSAAVFWRAFPRTSLFAEYTLTAVDYDDPAYDLDNEEQGFSLGATWEVTAITRGTAEIGARWIDFDNPAEEGYSTWGGFVDLQHELSDLTTLVLRGERSIEEGKYEGTRYVSSTGLTAGARHLFLDRITGTASAGYFWEDFSDPNPGDAATREDRTARFRLGAEYAFRPWLQFAVRYSFIDRDSSIDHYDATENTLTFEAAARF